MNLLRPRSLQNAASIPEIAIIDRRDIATITMSGNLVIAVTLKPLKDWNYLYLAHHLTSYQETAEDTLHGRVYKFQVEGFYPADTEELREMLAITEWRQYVVAVRDAHGIIRLCGNNHAGLTTGYDSVIDAEMGGRRGSTIRFYGQLAFPSAIWQI